MDTRKVVWLVIGILAIGGVVMLSHQLRGKSGTLERVAGGKLQVVASFYPLAYIAQEVGGTYVSIDTITPAGAEPHDFEPTPHDMARIETADVVLLNGARFEGWGDAVPRIVDASKTSVLTLSEGIADREMTEEGQSYRDPHIWLSPKKMEQMAERVAVVFAQKDPTHAAEYQAQLAAFTLKLELLDTAYTTGLSQCARKEFVTSHAAFGYMAAAYGLHQTAIAGLSPDAEPSAGQLAALADTVRREKISVIFFESLVSPRLSQTLAAEVGARTMVLDPIEGLTQEEIKNGATYLSKMEQNLANLRIALECK